MEGPKASSDDWAVTSRTTVDNVDPSHIQGEDTCGMLDGSFLELHRAAGKLRGDSQSPRLSSAVSEAKHLRASPLYTCMLQRWTPHVSINTFGLPSYHHLNCKYEAYFYCRYEVLRTSGHLKGVWFCVFLSSDQDAFFTLCCWNCIHRLLLSRALSLCSSSKHL